MNLPEDSWPPNIDPAVAAQIKGQRPYSVTPEQAGNFLYNNVVSNYLKDKPGAPMPPPGTTPGKIGPPSGPPSGLDIAGGILGDTATQFLTGGLGKVAPALGKLGASALTHGIFVGPAAVEKLGGSKMMHPAVWESLSPETKAHLTANPHLIPKVQDKLDQMMMSEFPHELKSPPSAEDADSFHKNFGWGYGADLKLRKEIPDTGARLDIQGFRGALAHPAGDLHSVFGVPPINFTVKVPHGAVAAAHPPTSQIAINPASSYFWQGGETTPINEKMLPVALHEMTHPIQEKSGFAIGSSPSHEYEQPDMYKILSNPADPQARQQAAYETYKQSAGENEANNVMSRFMDPRKYLQRPELTEQVPRNQQIIRFLQGQ